MKNYCIGLYEKAMPTEFTIEEKLLLAQKCGFDYMEISIDETEEKMGRIFSKKQTAQIKSACEKVGFPIQTMCLSGHRKYPLGEPDGKCMEIMRVAIDFSAELGIRIIQLAGYDTYYGTSDNQTKQRFLENLKKSVLYASQKGVMLGFETMETDFMNTCEKAMRYVNKINSPYLNVYPDLGNVTNATDDYLSDINCAKGHIVAAHLKETVPGKFRDLEYGQGRVDFKGCIDLLDKMGVNMFTCEFWYDGKTEPQEYVTRNKQYIDKFFENFGKGE